MARSILKLSLSGDGPYGKFVEAEINATVVGAFQTWMKKGLGYSWKAPIGKASEPILKLSTAMCAVSSQRFQEKAKKAFEERLRKEQYRKFKTGGYGNWPPLKETTLRRREYQTYIWNITPKSKDTPLFFSGTLSESVAEGLKISKFSFFSKKDWGKGFFKISNLNISVGWEDPEIEPPFWYFHWTKKSIKRFGDLIKFHRSRNRNPFIAGGKVKKLDTGEVVETPELTKGEFFRYVWSPFLKEDIEKIFTVDKNDIKEAAERTFEAIEDLMEQLDLTNKARRELYNLIKSKQVSVKDVYNELKKALRKELKGG